jgi:hypothetical protein
MDVGFSLGMGTPTIVVMRDMPKEDRSGRLAFYRIWCLHGQWEHRRGNGVFKVRFPLDIAGGKGA